MPTVKGLFDRYCMSENDGADSGLRSSMSFDEFNIFIRDFHLLDHLFSARECILLGESFARYMLIKMHAVP